MAASSQVLAGSRCGRDGPGDGVGRGVFAPLRLELAPGKVIDTFGYSGTVPGPVLRLREGR